MKYRATLDLDLTNNEIIEDTVIEACRAYAKTVAREAMKDEINDEIASKVRSVVKSNFQGFCNFPTSVDKITKNYIAEYLKSDMDFNEQVRASCIKYVDEAIVKEREAIEKYITNELCKTFTGSFITTLIPEEVKKAVPEAVMNVLREK